jgi:hypothetical protein
MQGCDASYSCHFLVLKDEYLRFTEVLKFPTFINFEKFERLNCTIA